LSSNARQELTCQGFDFARATGRFCRLDERSTQSCGICHTLLGQEGSMVETKSRSYGRRFQKRILTRFVSEPPLARHLAGRAALLTQEGVNAPLNGPLIRAIGTTSAIQKRQSQEV
jgi:hypothetical protein